MSTLSKEAAGVPPLVTLFLQYGISLLVFLPSAARAGRIGLSTARFPLQLFRSLAGAVCQLLFFMGREIHSTFGFRASLQCRTALHSAGSVRMDGQDRTPVSLGKFDGWAGWNSADHQAWPADVS